MNSRERMLTAISCGQPDRVPIYFCLWQSPPHLRYESEFERVEQLNKMGLDDILDVFLPTAVNPEVQERHWREEPSDDEPYPLMGKEYETPAGVLRQVVREADDELGEGWSRQMKKVNLMDDFNVARAKEHAVCGPEDLPKLRHLLVELSGERLSHVRAGLKRKREFARKQGTLVAGWGACGMDAAIWLCGVEGAVLAAVDTPDFFDELLDIIHIWDKKNCELLLDEGVDMLVRRGWYDTTRIWSPELYGRLIAPRLKELVGMAHQADVKFAYTMSSGIMPLLETFKEIGFDLLYHVDPVQGGADLAVVKEKLQGQIAVLGGINGAITLERGSGDEIRQAVFEAVEVLAPGGGFILSPVDCVSPNISREACEAVIEAWREVCEYDTEQ